MRSLALTGVRAHRGSYVGAGLVLAVAAAVVAVTGVLLVAGAQAQASGDVLAGGMLIALASSFSGTALIVVIMVVASTVSLALRGRRREFALLRAVGTTPRQVRELVTREVAMVALVAAPPGAVLGMLGTRLLDPLLVRAGMAEPEYHSPLSAVAVVGAVALVLVTAVPVGRLAAREAARIAPTAALRESAVEPRALSRGRVISAEVLAVLGLASAFSPLFLPGLMGSAIAAVSAFCLVGAGALAGPTIVGWVFDRLARLPAGPSTTLAIQNVRGFSRRLTTVVVPLALVVAVATVQATVDRTVRTAAAEQLRAALSADLVATPGGGSPTSAPGASDPTAGIAPDTVVAAATIPGVASVLPLATIAAQVRTDNDPEQPFGQALAWEAAGLRVLPAEPAEPLLDPDVTQGSLADLSTPDTIAISTDAAFEIGRGLGDTIDIRLGTDSIEAKVVAIYSRGLGVGDYVTGPATPAAHDVPVPPDTLLIGLDPGASARSVRTSLTDLGMEPTSVPAYITAATSTAGGSQALSNALLLLLLGVVAVGAASALALTTASRGDEFTLLHRTGTTRRQLLAMTGVESLITGLTAWALGTIAVIPAVIGITAGLLPGHAPLVDLPTYALVSAGVLALAATTSRFARLPRLATS